jgi:hypothetical protein
LGGSETRKSDESVGTLWNVLALMIGGISPRCRTRRMVQLLPGWEMRGLKAYGCPIDVKWGSNLIFSRQIFLERG